MRTTCSVAIQNMGLKLELNLMKQLVFILSCLYHICAEYEFETFGSTSDQICLMAFYLHTDVIDIGLETIFYIVETTYGLMHIGLETIFVHSFGQFGMKRSPVRKSYGYESLQPGQLLSSFHFCHQVPPYVQSRQRS